MDTERAGQLMEALLGRIHRHATHTVTMCVALSALSRIVTFNGRDGGPRSHRAAVVLAPFM